MTRIDLSDSKSWYLSEEQAQTYLDLMTSAYAGGIVLAEDCLLRENIGTIDNFVKERSQYVDLGPGDCKKTKFMLDSLRLKISKYMGVDIQRAYLETAEETAAQTGIPSKSFKGSFEDFLKNFEKERSFVYLGATFGNLENTFDTLLANTVARDNTVYLSNALLPENPSDLIEQYQMTKSMFVPLARKQGISQENFQVEFNSDLHQVELGFVDGNYFYIFGVSRKPTVIEFKERVETNFSGEYFWNDNHIGFVGRKN